MRFDDLGDDIFEEKLVVQELTPGFFEFNQKFKIGESDQDLWEYKLIFDTTYDWFSSSFIGEDSNFLSSIGAGDIVERQWFDGDDVVISFKINIPESTFWQKIESEFIEIEQSVDLETRTWWRSIKNKEQSFEKTWDFLASGMIV